MVKGRDLRYIEVCVCVCVWVGVWVGGWVGGGGWVWVGVCMEGGRESYIICL